MLKRTLSLLLALVLLANIPSALAVRWPEKEHLPVDFADMPLTGFDETALNAALNSIERLSTFVGPIRDEKQRAQRVEELYEQVLAELNVLVTQVNLSSIQYDVTGGSPEAAALYSQLSAQWTRLFDRCYEVLGLLAGTPLQEIVEADAGKGALYGLAGYEAMSDERAALYAEEDRLCQAYDQLFSAPPQAELEGVIWSVDDLDRQDLDADTYFAVSDALAQARNQAAGEIFRQLVQVRTSIAQEAGYDSYADYAYWAAYNRDYDLEDIRPVRDAVKSFFPALAQRALADVSQQDVRKLEIRGRASGEKILEDIQPFMDSFDPELGKTFSFLREHHLYDIEYTPDKIPTGYTLALPAYGSAFIFNSPYGDYQDYSDTVHEFGHFNETFHCATHELWSDFNIDVGEIHSQALELMFTSYAPNIFGEDAGEAYTRLILYWILNSVIDGCLYDEFQEAVYASPDMSLEEINRLFQDLAVEYGYERGDLDWVDNAHNFQSPMYFISYATSALSALDLWMLYLTRPDKAEKLYLELSALSLSLPYRAAVDTVGLRDIFDGDTLPKLAEAMGDYLDGNLPAAYSGSSMGLAVIGGCALAAALVLVLLVRNRRKRKVYAAVEPWEF